MAADIGHLSDVARGPSRDAAVVIDERTYDDVTSEPIFQPVEWRSSAVSSPGEPDGNFLLPVGTVTLLLSDFEGSVRAWQTDPDAMAEVVADLADLVGETIAEHGGVRPLEQGEGDSFVAAFSRASEALEAALAIQRATAARSWPGDLAVRLRMGMHTGEAQLRDAANYMGAAINRCARLRALAHGGQVLLSGATHDLVQDRLPADVTFLDLGPHRLRDLARAEQVWQLVHPELPADFPPLRGLDRVPNNLPTQLTTFVGRTQEIAAVANAISDTRLVTLTGSGGCGKTRLAVQTAAELSTTFPDGAWFVDLSPVTEARGVGVAVAHALGVTSTPGVDAMTSVVERLAESSALLIVDNCEHLVDACCEVIERVLQNCPDVRIITTSREVLGVAGEVPWRVPSLSLPGESVADLTSLTTSDAVRLFIDRATKARPNFTVTNDNAGDIAAVCRRLDGLPLAIELAAARVRVLSPAQISAGLDDRFRLLGGGARTALARQQTLAASVAWSHDLLSEPEAALFRRLSAFATTFSLDAAEAAGTGDHVSTVEVLDLLAALVDKSLVHADDEGSVTRFRLLETLRAFAADRLADAGEVDSTMARVCDYFRDFVRGSYLRRPRETVSEVDNLRVAVAWALGADATRALELATTVGQVFSGIGRPDVARRWLQEALERTNEPPDDALAVLRARAYAEVAYLSFPMADFAAVPAAASAAIDLGRAARDDRAVGRGLSARAWVTGVMGFKDMAFSDLLEALELARRCGDKWSEIETLKNLGYLSDCYGDFADARRYLTEAVAAGDAYGDPMKRAEAMLWLVWADMLTGKLEDGLTRTRGLIDEFGAGGIRFFEVVAESYAAILHAWMGAPDEALAHGRRAVALSEKLSPGSGVDGLAYSALGLGQLAAGERVEGVQSMREAAARMPAGASSPIMRTNTLGLLAEALIEEGDLDAAEAVLLEALPVARGANMRAHVTRCLLHASRLAARRGDFEHAEASAHEALELSLACGAQVGAAAALAALAAPAASVESYAEAARLRAAADAILTSLRFVRLPEEKTEDDALVAQLRAALGDDDFDAATAEGATLDFDAAVAYARRGRGERKRPSAGWAALTPTELDVVALVTEGLTNPQIAERLFVSRTTVKTHLGHVFAKLGVTTRAELSALAVRREQG